MQASAVFGASCDRQKKGKRERRNHPLKNHSTTNTDTITSASIIASNQQVSTVLLFKQHHPHQIPAYLVDDVFIVQSILTLSWNPANGHVQLRPQLLLFASAITTTDGRCLRPHRGRLLLNRQLYPTVMSRTPDQMSQPAAPWNADNFGTPSGSIGTIKLYNPADFQNNTVSGIHPFPVGGLTITEQPGKTCDTGQQPTPVTTVFQSYNPSTGQPTNQVPPDKESSGQFNQSQTNATMNGSWGWDPSWGEHSSSWLGANSSNQSTDGDTSFGSRFDKQSMQGPSIHYFDQNQNLPQNTSTGQDWSTMHSQQQPQMQQQSQQQMLPPQQLSQEGNLNSSQNAPLPPTNVPQYLEVATSSAQPYSQSGYPVFNDYLSPMSVSTPSMGAPSSLSSPSTGQMSLPSDQQFGQANPNPPSLNWPEVPTDSDLSKPSDQRNEPSLPPSNSGQLVNMGFQPNASNYFSSQGASEHFLWQPTKSGEENSGQFSLGTPASLSMSTTRPVAMSTTGPVAMSAAGTMAMSTAGPVAMSAAGTMAMSTAGPVAMSAAGPMAMSTAGHVAMSAAGHVAMSAAGPMAMSAAGTVSVSGSIPTSNLPQQPAWSDVSHKQNARDRSIQHFQPYHTNLQTTEPYFGQNPPFLEGNSTDNTNNTSSGTIPMDTITQSFSQASISESAIAKSIPSSVSNISQKLADISLGNNFTSDSSKMAEVTGLQLHQQNPQQENESPQFPSVTSVDNTIKHGSVVGDWEVVPNSDPGQHSRQSSLGNAQFLEGSNQNMVAFKTSTMVSSSQPLPVNQAIFDSFNIANLEPNVQPSLPLSKPSSSGQPLSVAPPIPSQMLPQSTDVPSEVGSQHEAEVVTDLSPGTNSNTQKQNTSKLPSVEATPNANAAIIDSFTVKTPLSNDSVQVLPTSLSGLGTPKLDGNILLNEHKLNVYASEIQPRDSSPFQPPPPRQGSVEGVHPQSTSRSSTHESGHASQTSRNSSQICSASSDGGRSSCGSQSSGTRPPPTLSRQSSHDSTRSLGSNAGSRSGMKQIKEQAGDAKIQPPLPSGNKGISWHDQTSAAIRATAVAEARVQECMSPMTTLWDNPQISVSGIHLVPSVPIPSLVGAESVTNQPVNIVTSKSSVVESKPKIENPKNQTQLSERSSSSQPLTSTPNSSTAITSNSHESSPIKPEQKSPTHSLEDTSMSERDYDRKDPRDRPSRDRDRDRDRDPRDRDRERDPRDHRDPDFRDRDFHDSREALDDYRELRDSRREKDYRYIRDYDRDYRSRYRSLDPKDPRYDPYYDRPPSRLDYERYLEYQYYRDEAYDRPRSRQALPIPLPPPLTPPPHWKKALQIPLPPPLTPPPHWKKDDADAKSERPLSRAEYSRYVKDYNKYKDIYSDYDSDYYSRSTAYYNYYRDRYTRPGYYDDVDSWYYHDRARRYHRPCYLPSYSQYEEYYGAGAFDGYDNASRTSREQSRAQTPAMESVPSTIPPHYLHRDAAAAYEQGQDMYDYYYSRGYYGNEDWSSHDEKLMEYYNQGRMTPAKFFTPHTCAAFGPGGRLIHVLPNRPADGQTATVEIINVEDILSDQKEAEEFHNFPGPLIRGETHKNDVLVFCQNKAKQYSENVDVIDRESAALLWRFFELLIKQNGTIVGTDIADLLLEGHQPLTADYLEGANKDDDEFDTTRPPSAQGSDTGTVTIADKAIVNKSTTATLNERTDRFRHLLLYGMKKDSLRWAMKNNLWGHALFLASKMDNRTHADIMTRFANSAIQMNDPLQTLYQLMSGRQPASVTSLCDDNWGDWRPHLAMILSNHSSRPELDKKSITTLGDTLASKGCLHASHFCYLMAQVNFGTYSKKSSKLVLIGSSHSLSLNEFATNEAIQCTEIFEYAQLLGNSMYLMPSFQPYKLLYACRLADYGLTHEALHYCEVIASTVIQNPVYYQYTVVKVLADISNRLKCYDPQHLQMGDMTDPMWLQQLSNVCQSFEDGSIQPLSGSVTPLGPHVTANSSESGEIAAYLNHTQDSLLPRYPQQVPVGGPYVQNSQLMSSYTQDAYQQQYQHQTTFYDNLGQPQQQQQQQQRYGENLEYAYNTQQQPQTEAVPDPSYTYQSQGISQTDSATYTSQDLRQKNATSGASVKQQQQMMAPPPMTQSWQPQEPSQMGNHDQILSTNPEDEETAEDSLTRRASASSIITSTTATTVDSNQTMATGGGFDYFEASTRKTIIPPTRYGVNRQRTLSESSNASTGSVKKAPSQSSKKTEVAKQKPADQKSWWNIFSNFGGQRKKDMILPDDKNPSIVWDPDRQRWINKEEEDEPDTPNVPPPKDIELKSTPAVSGPPPPNGNLFSRPRARGARSKYVDVMNPNATSQAVPENLFNVLPPTTGVTSIQNIFVPSGTNPSSETTSSMTTNGQNENDSVSPGYNHVTEPSAGELSRSSSMSSLSQEVHQLTRKQSVQSSSSSSVSVQQPMPAPASGPMLYNPASFQNQSFASAPSSGPTSRLAQRRVYPK